MQNFFFTFDGKRHEGNFHFEPIADHNVISIFILDDVVAKIAGQHFHFIKHINPGSYYQFAFSGSDQEKALKSAIIDELHQFNL